MNEPSVDEFRRNALLTTIAHAIWVVRHPTLAYERQWIDGTYCVNNSMGVAGAVYLGGRMTVGAVFDQNSPRNPLGGDQPAGADRFLRTLPGDLRPIMMQRAIALLPSDPQTSDRLVTAAFWQVGTTLHADEPWDQVCEHGARVFRLELLDEKTALQEVMNEYQLEQPASDIVVAIYKERLRSGSTEIQLDPGISAAIARLGRDGLDACRDLLAGIGIQLAPPQG